SGGYDVDLFVDTPHHDLICPICHGVFRCPVTAVCSHVFCRNCILEWIKRQETCPYCRHPVSQSSISGMCKLSTSISRLWIKCKNKAQGCDATFPLSEECLHSVVCQYELILCPHHGCGMQLPRRHLGGHMQSCRRWRGPCCSGCGTPFSHHMQTQQNCYRQLRQELESRWEMHRIIAADLQRKMRRIQNTVVHMRRQVNLICQSLEVMNKQEVARSTGGNSGCAL
ncbi:RING finger protein 151-like, partial [Scleropages formosus]